MKTIKMLAILVLALGIVVCMAGVSEAVPLDTAFTYQGRLIDANSTADGLYDFQFALYDSNDPNGNQLGSDVNKPDVDVIDGYFTVALDFGGGVFDGNAVWLETGVRPGEMNDPNVYTELSPRQEITPTPYALHTRWLLVDEALNNIFAGEDAGASITTGFYNSAVGYAALYSNTGGSWNSAVGNQALRSNTTGSYNSAVGEDALYSNTTGGYNSAMGSYALYSNTTGSSNSAVGYAALYSNTEGAGNAVMGQGALYFNTAGMRNSAMGYYALLSNTTGNSNSAMGNRAGYSNSTGSGNVFLGYKAGYYETGDNKLYIANDSADANVLIYGDFSTNQIGIARVPTTNAFEVEGTASKTTSGNWLANSDERIKTDIQTVTNALETLDKVRLVSFRYRDDYQAEHPSIEKRRYLNVIAQEFRQVFPEYVKSSKEKLTNGEEILQVDAYPLTVYSAAAVQELHEIVKAKDAEISVLKERMSRMETLLDDLARKQKGVQK